LVFVGDLNVKELSKSAKGTLENPGKNVKVKSALNRSILDQGWGEFIRQLDYKLTWQGGKLIKVDPAYISMTCSSCKNIEDERDKGPSMLKKTDPPSAKKTDPLNAQAA